MSERKPGRPMGAKDRNPRKGPMHVGSRPWMLSNMAIGDVLLFENKNGGPVGKLMQQIACDVSRIGFKGKVVQSHLLAVQPTSREVFDIVRVERTCL